MSESKFSLCITYPNIKDPSKKNMFRIADVIDDYLIQAQYTYVIDEQYTDEYQPRNIGCKPTDAVLNRAEIREWWIDEQGGKFPFSKGCQKLFYEVVFPKEFDGISLDKEEEIRKVFKNGLELFDGVSDNLLLVIDEEDDYYIALECNKKDFIIHNNHFKINSNISDIIHVPHFFYKEYIHKNDLISSENAGIYIAEGNRAENRYFYKYLTLEEPDEGVEGKFYLRDFTEYVPVFISKYLKLQKGKIEFSNNEIKKIVSIVDEILKQETNLKEFFEITGYTVGDVIEQMPNYKNQIVEVFLGDDSITRIIERHIFNSEVIHSQCLEIVKKSWFKEKDSIRDKLEQELNKKESELQELTKIIDEKKYVDESLEKKKRDLSEHVERLVKKENVITEQIKNKLIDFEDNLIDYIANRAFLNSTDKSTADLKKMYEDENILLSEGNLFEFSGEIEHIDNPGDFIGDLSENLQTIGISSEYSYDLAQSVFAAICMRMGIMAVGCYAREFANIISALIGAQRSSVLTLPVGFSNLSELVCKIVNSESKVILIENALDNLTETLCISVIKQCQDKILIFSMEDRDNVITLSKSVWNYLFLVDLDFMLEYPKEGDLLLSKITQDVFECSDIKMSLTSEFKKILSLTSVLKLPKSTAIKLSQIGCIIKNINDSRWINTIVLLEILNLSKTTEKIDELMSLGEDILTEKQKALVSSFIKERGLNE